MHKTNLSALCLSASQQPIFITVFEFANGGVQSATLSKFAESPCHTRTQETDRLSLREAKTAVDMLVRWPLYLSGCRKTKIICPIASSNMQWYVSHAYLDVSHPNSRQIAPMLTFLHHISWCAVSLNCKRWAIELCMKLMLYTQTSITSKIRTLP